MDNVDELLNEVYFNAGCIKQAGYVLISSKLDQLNYEDQFTRIFLYKNDTWGKKDINGWDAVSVCYSKELDALCVLSKEGDILIGKSNEFLREKINDAGVRSGIHGYVSHIREIGKTLFVCGQSGQIYKRESSGWVHFDLGVLVPMAVELGTSAFLDSPILNCVDGFNDSDLYVVGDSGAIYHFNGEMWKKILVNCKEHLQWVRCYKDNEVWICGYNGTVLKGNMQDGFVDVSSVDDNRTFWSLVKFKENIYLSTIDHLYIYSGQGISIVETKLEPELLTYCLDACDDELWSFGSKDIARFDGTTWERIHHPDNPPIGGSSIKGGKP
ncbi:hypothetical protein AAKU64_004629 [Undibacterium sp. GrIS 1.8]|uniref:hypothetical protein n=1 Tax=unclassified Undibacterium TaxID=2630295 RepID=UPI003399B444